MESGRLHSSDLFLSGVAAKKQGFHTSTQNTQAAGAALIFMKLMVRGTGISSSHRRSVLGDKGCALRTVDKGISRGPDPCPWDKQIKDRQARIRAGARTRTGIQSVRAVQCYIIALLMHNVF